MKATFDADKLAAYAAKHKGSNILIEITSKKIKALAVLKPSHKLTADEGLEGCPYPPGCN
jgi:hypothetical protein